jgi:hypothetical protein
LVPEIVAVEMLTVAVPVFVTLRLCVALLPTETSPKLMVLGFAESAPGAPVEFVALTRPAQPDKPTIAGIDAKSHRRRKALSARRCFISATEHTRSPLLIRTNSLRPKAALLRKIQEEIAVAAIYGPKFCIPTYEHTKRRNRTKTTGTEVSFGSVE